MGEFVRVETEGAVGVIRLDRPKMNALNVQVQRELHEAAGQVGADETIRAVVIWGGEKVFAAGADIKEMEQMSYADMAHHSGRLQDAFKALANIPKPVIAAITGYALGGGCELALTADFRVAAEDAKLGQPEILLGLIPGAGGTQRLPRLVGRVRANELLLTGRFLTADEAHAWGLVNRVVPKDELLDAAAEVAAAVAAQAPLAVSMIKRLVREGLDASLPTALTLEQDATAQLIVTEDALEGIAAFSEKRAPQFHGTRTA
jgi:enoyl-CoA hydratase/carnithine racemase